MRSKVKPKSVLKTITKRGVLLDLERKGITLDLSQKAIEAFLGNFKQRGICSARKVDRRIAALESMSLERRKAAYAIVGPKEKIGYIKQVYPIRNANGLVTRIEADVVLFKHRLAALGFKGSVKAMVRCRRVETSTYRDTLILNELLGFDFVLKNKQPVLTK